MVVGGAFAGQLADKPNRGLDKSRTSQLADTGVNSRMDRSRTGLLANTGVKSRTARRLAGWSTE